MLWLKLVMYRPHLLPVFAPQDVTRQVEALAGQVADLLSRPEHQNAPSEVVGAANEVLDACCQFVERWTEQIRGAEAFEADVTQLRACLSEIDRRFSLDVVAVRRDATLLVALECSIDL
ncbi:hypothetical protein [Kibdelosporangium persicum]|uniref:hypothetical protein n=1 Tax=Kibdelosporangium persicum TaxID=2698649 RepID=UPI001565BE95|nr:hypothetical protein [Kibdelosporangium persicum]